MTLHIEAPTDSQLVYVRVLCERYGIEPERLVVGSKQDATALIGALRENTSVEPWEWDNVVRGWAEAVPF